MNEKDESKIILPFPENILKRLNQEKSVRNETLVEVATDQECQDHLWLIGESLHWIEELGLNRIPRDENEIVVKGVIFRTYNDALTALILMLSGFQQVSFMPQRDMLECSLLLYKFYVDPSSIQRWKENSNRREFWPSDIRKFLDAHEKELKIKKGKMIGLKTVYSALSGHGIHPTYQGIARMLTKECDPSHNLCWGPFFDLEKLRIFLHLFASFSVFTSNAIVYTFGSENLSSTLRKKNTKFLDDALLWLKKYGWLSKNDIIPQD